MTTLPLRETVARLGHSTYVHPNYRGIIGELPVRSVMADAGSQRECSRGPASRALSLEDSPRDGGRLWRHPPATPPIGLETGRCSARRATIAMADAVGVPSIRHSGGLSRRGR